MKLKNILPVLILLSLVIGGVFFYRSQKRPINTITTEVQSGVAVMHISENSYDPVNIKIKVGTKVAFINDSKDYRWPASDLHPSHLIYPEFDSKEALKPGDSWDFIFNKVGEWGYHDHLAPYITGTITVVE